MGNAEDIQKQILGEISIRGNIPAEALAKRIRVRPHVVRYHLHRLLRSGSLRRTVLIDQRNLGYQSSTILFNLTTQYQSNAIKFFQSRRCISWLAHNNGIREFEMSLVTTSPADAIALTTDLANKTGATVLDPLVAYEEDIYEWGLRVFSAQPELVKPLAFKRQGHFEADDLDTRIIRAYRECDDSDLNSLARQVGAARSTLIYRLERLRNAGVISDDLYVVMDSFNPTPKGCVFVQIGPLSKSIHERFLAFCQNKRHVSSLVACTGNWDYRLIVYGRDMQDLFDFEDSLKATFQSEIRGYHMVLRRRFLKLSAGV